MAPPENLTAPSEPAQPPLPAAKPKEKKKDEDLVSAPCSLHA
jgi:hypothetical protein